jgi:hypothetical protein
MSRLTHFNRLGRLIILSTLFAALAAVPAYAQDPAVPDIGTLGIQLVALAVVVLVVESALATIFQWRVYRMLFNNRAMKTVVMVAVGLTVVLAFNYDVFAKIISLVIPGTTPDNWSGKISTLLSALIIAGGSSGVNTIFQRLGIRNPVAAEPERPILNDKQAWFSLRVHRRSAVGPIKIAIDEIPDDPLLPILAGTVGDRTFIDRLKEAFFANSMRFPPYGGRTMEVGKTYEIVAYGTRMVDNAPEPIAETVFKGGFAPRAIVDFTVTL